MWLALAAAAVAPHFMPVPPWQPLVEIERNQTANPTTRTIVRKFRVSGPDQTHRLGIDSDTRKGRFSITIAGNKNAASRYDIWSGRHKQQQMYTDPWGLRPGKAYSVRVEETNFVGWYRIKLYPTSDASTWVERARAARATKASFILAAFALGLMAYCSLVRRSAQLVILVGFIPLLDTIYAAVHELGHHIAHLCFGAADFASGDYLGLSGIPYAAVAIGARLDDWQNALAALSGPVFPTLVAYLLFTGIVFIRKRNPSSLITVWGAGLLMVWGRLLFSQVVYIPLAMGILSDGPDGDYAHFSYYYHGPIFPVNLLMILLAAINICLGAVAIGWFLAERNKTAALQKAKAG